MSPVQAASAVAKITIRHESKRLDMSVPLNATPEEALPEVARYLGTLGHGGSYDGYLLTRLHGASLERDRALEDQGVVDGDEFRLTLAREVEPPKVYDDIVEAVGEAVGSASKPWSPEDTAATAEAATVILAAVGAGLLALGEPTTTGLVLATCGLGLIVAGAAVLVRLGRGRGAIGMTLTAALYGGVVGRMVGEFLAPEWAWTTACVGLFVAGVLSMITLPRDREAALAPITVGVALGAATAATHLFDLAAPGVFAITAAVAGTLTNAIPWLAMNTTRIKAATPVPVGGVLQEQPPIDGEELQQRFIQGQRILVYLRAASMVVVLVSIPVMVKGGVAALIEAVALFLGLLLSSRQAYSRLEVGLIGMIAVLGLGLTAWTAGLAHPEWSGPVVAVLGLAAAATAALTLFGRAKGAGLGRIADLVDLVALVSLLPLAVVVAGLA
ncbi:MAG: hypothetical protein LBJ02_04000 [Bifidobacteriaceae bacterium]|jgi:type VII secretion integral membrane protein EccD|nr:hypothetical protein [Bifidobacteriaceae bacterium]